MKYLTGQNKTGHFLLQAIWLADKTTIITSHSTGWYKTLHYYKIFSKNKTGHFVTSHLADRYTTEQLLQVITSAATKPHGVYKTQDSPLLQAIAMASTKHHTCYTQIILLANTRRNTHHKPFHWLTPIKTLLRTSWLN